MSPVRNNGDQDLIDAPKAGASPARRVRSFHERSSPCSAQVRRHSCRHHNAGHIFEQSNGVLYAAFVSKVVGQGLGVDDRRFCFDPRQRPRAGADVSITRFGPSDRHGGDGAGGIVRAGRNYRDRLAQTGFGGNVG